MAYATVNVFDTSGHTIASTYSSEAGLFVINISEYGDYSAEISMVGYKHTLFEIKLKDSLVGDLGTLLITKGDDILEEVQIVSRKRLVDQKPGMLVYNAENDVSNQGGTAADVLRKAPILNVDA